MHNIQFKNALITVYESALFRTTSSLIETTDFILLVDPNWLPFEIKNLQAQIQSKPKEKPVFLLFTHLPTRGLLILLRYHSFQVSVAD